MKEGSILYPERTVSSPALAVKLIRPFLEDCDREKFMVVYLNTKNEPVCINTVSIGTVNASLVNPSEVFKIGMLSNCNSLILFHNHPSGSTVPSQEDKAITKRLLECGTLLGLKVLDHIIVGAEGAFYSFKEQQQL